MFKIFIPIIIFFSSSNLFSNDSLKHTQLFCPDYFYKIHDESVEIAAFEFLDEDKVNIYWGSYSTTFFNKDLIIIKGTYSKNLKKIHIGPTGSVQQGFSDSEFNIDRKTLKLTFSFSGYESTKECNVINEPDLKDYVKSYFEQEIIKIEKKVKSENKI